MDIYLPIAEISVNAVAIILLGALVGYVSGMFGVGGGFLTTPLLIFYGIPAPIAVASAANQVTGASVSAALAHWRRGGIDFKMAGILVAGGILGSTLGSFLFKYLRSVGQADAFISLAYILVLGSVGSMMLVESVRSILRARRGDAPELARKRHDTLAYRMPLKIRFRKSGLYISLWAPVGLGLLVGLLNALMGVGGGFVLLPAMIYWLGMPAAVVVGTSLIYIVITSAIVTLLHAVNTQTVDIVLASLLLFGGVIGAQFGTTMTRKLKGEHLRLLLALMVLMVAVRLLFGMTLHPHELYLITAGTGT